MFELFDDKNNLLSIFSVSVAIDIVSEEIVYNFYFIVYVVC